MFRRLSIITVLGLMAAATPAMAAPVFDFSGGAGGTFTQNGSNFSGSGISISSLLFFDSTNPSAFTTLSIQSGTLSFNTATGTLSIVGGVSGAGIAAGTTLLSGTIGSFSSSVGGSGLLTLTLNGNDTLNAALIAALGLPATAQFANFGFTLHGINTGGSNFAAFSPDLGSTPIPESGTLLLLGAGMIGIGATVRRRLRRSVA